MQTQAVKSVCLPVTDLCDGIGCAHYNSCLYYIPATNILKRIIAGMSADIPADIPTDNSQHAIYPISRYFFYVVKLPAHPMP